MDVRIEKSKATGVMIAPPSKSVSHRLLICAALADGVSHVSGLAMSDDIKATLACLNALGIRTETNGDTVTVYAGTLEPVSELACNESGSTLRFMIPICLLQPKRVTLTGTERLISRSLSVYEDALPDVYFGIDKTSVTVEGRLTGGVYRVRGDVSSQFITGLMFALPLLEQDSVIEIEGRLESAPYVDITADTLKTFGVSAVREDTRIVIKGGQQYKACNVTVEGDLSNAAFFDALTLMGGDVTVEGLNENTLQGDRIYKEYFRKIKDGYCELDVSDCPDLAPILMAMGAAHDGVTLCGTRRLKIKESDRGEAMAAELKKLGVPCTVFENSITVGCGVHAPTDLLYGHNDHRIVMSLTVLLTRTGGVITGAQAVAKSLPDFFERLGKLGVIYEIK